MQTVLADGALAAAGDYTTATGPFTSMWLLIVLPLVGAAVLLLAGRRADSWGHLLGCGTVIASFALGLWYFISLSGQDESAKAMSLELFTWVPVGGLNVEAGLLFDPLSAVFVLLITGVGALIHVYSIGYMANDEGRRRFFAYLNLFVAAMLLLVLGNSFVALYFGWEGVGLASYLLIAFWYQRPAAATAAKKAFIMNRVGDAGLVIAIFLMFAQLGSTSFADVFSGASGLSAGVVTALAILLLLGACGKSGQFPLQGWLPDAMEGPTPVSALIHAATMVTAGVYLIARSAPIYNLTEDGRLIVTIVGALTILIGCIIGCAYDDIKKVLAYSTVSQIGYMFLAVGLGPAGYALGIFHLLTHGFFKAGLFLGAGSVMHGMNDEVDMRKYGGLARYMPITFVTFGLAYLALIGFPFLSGYFSKDEIVAAAFAQEGWRGWVFGGAAALGAGLTAFYMTRLMLMTFFGEKRWENLRTAEGKEFHPHESPPVMTVPMIILAFGSVGAGFLLYSGDWLVEWLAPSVGALAHPEGVVPHSAVPWILIGFAALGVIVAWLFVGRREVPLTPPVRVSPVVRAARANLYGDAFNEAVFARPGEWLTRMLVWWDNRGVDGAVNGLAAFLGGSSGRLRRTQTGFVRSYALSMLGGTVVVMLALLAVRFA